MTHLNPRRTLYVPLFFLFAFAAVEPLLAQPTGNTVGVTFQSTEASEGYTLFGLLGSTNTYLINNQGELIQRWRSPYMPGAAVYLLESGNLLRTARKGSGFNAGGTGGRIEEYDWAGDLVWSYDYANAEVRQHHDTIQLPNGNILMVAWELKTSSQALAAGRKLSLLAFGNLWPDHLVEIQPSGSTNGVIVWEWHAWDHLIQDYDPSKSNYGVVADHPELIDVNYPESPFSDWLHVNSVDYNQELDQILISVHNFGEIWILDHSTTSAEASTHAGGRSGKGGDLLYRWGNPGAYRASAGQILFGQHNAQWIRDGLNGAGNILIFNNGLGRPGAAYSSAEEIIPPLDESGLYFVVNGTFDPSAPLWTYRAEPPESFYAQNVSSVQRLPNGNTLICDGPHGVFFEVTGAGNTVWRYVSPVTSSGLLAQGSAPPAQNQIFRAVRYAPNFSGLIGRPLTPLGQLELPPTYEFLFTEIKRAPDAIQLRWKSQPDQNYVVQFRPDLNSDWEIIATTTAIGTEAILTDDDSTRIEQGAGFYRALAGDGPSPD